MAYIKEYSQNFVSAWGTPTDLLSGSDVPEVILQSSAINY